MTDFTKIPKYDLHVHFNGAIPCGVSNREILVWFDEAFSQCKDLYDVDLRLIISIRRDANQILDYYKILDDITKNRPKSLVGFDLTGKETEYRNCEWPNFFQQVRSLGYGITIHAGELESKDNVIYEIEKCKADRNGHGLSVEFDDELSKLCVNHQSTVLSYRR